ncbi:MAG: zinc transporter ZntB [Kofleriaceae bacterium]
MSTGLLNAFVLGAAGGARALDWEGVARWTAGEGPLWLHLDYTEQDAAAWLDERSGIDPLLREALLDRDPRPRAVASGEHLMLIVRGINQNQGAEPEDMISIRVWAERDRLITMRHRRSRSLESLVEAAARGRGPASTGELVTELVDRIVDHVVGRVDLLSDEVAASGDQALASTRGELRAQLADHRRQAIALRRFLAPQREALAKLAQLTVPWLDADHRRRIVETADRMTRAIEELDAARDRAAVTQEELASRLTETTNQRLYVLSLITAVFLPIGFVCTLLGVNVGGIPLRDDSWGFWALCGALGVGVAIQIWIFRRRGWLGRREW